MQTLLILLLGIPGILIATTLHEFTRGAVSTALGDKKPKQDKRLTLNPFKHFEPVGFLLMFATGFGWGKPVETSALYYKDRKRDTLLTAILPTVVNFIAAFIFMVLYRVFYGDPTGILTILFRRAVYFNISLAVYNFVPVAPMDCAKVLSVLIPANNYYKYLQYEKVIQMVFLLLLFMGVTDFIFVPLINGLELLLYAVVF